MPDPAPDPKYYTFPTIPNNQGFTVHWRTTRCPNRHARQTLRNLVWLMAARKVNPLQIPRAADVLRKYINHPALHYRIQQAALRVHLQIIKPLEEPTPIENFLRQCLRDQVAVNPVTPVN